MVELNPVLEVSVFRAEAVPALWNWEKLGGLHGPMSVVGSLWGPWRMQTGSFQCFTEARARGELWEQLWELYEQEQFICCIN